MPRLTDKHIAAIRAAAEDNDQTYGFGDVILLCDELQERRVADPAPVKVWEVNEEVTNVTLMDAFINRIEKQEAFRDGDVLAMFHALQRQGYFQTICWVERDALKQVLNALNGAPHLIRELQATRGLPRVDGEKLNAIDQLIQDCKGPKDATD